LEQRLSELTRNQEIIAYCRGPYCVLSFEAVAEVRARGFKVRRLEEGFPEWRAAGLPIRVRRIEVDRLAQTVGVWIAFAIGLPIALSERGRGGLGQVVQAIKGGKAAKSKTFAAIIRDTRGRWRVGRGHRDPQGLPERGWCRDG
jgi:hypothetical protein